MSAFFKAMMSGKDEAMSYKDGQVPLDIILLKEHRKKLGLSQEKRAEQCLKKGLLVSVSSIKQAELGMNVLYRTAANLAKFHDIPAKTRRADTQTQVTDQPIFPITASSFPYCKKALLTIVLEIGTQV